MKLIKFINPLVIGLFLIGLSLNLEAGCKTPERGPQGPQGVAGIPGTQGPTGAPGPQGVPGISFTPAFASYYDTEQVYDSGSTALTPIEFPEPQFTPVGISKVNNAQFQADDSGYYLIAWSLTFLSDSDNNASFVIRLTDELNDPYLPNPMSEHLILGGIVTIPESVDGQIIAPLSAGDVVQLQYQASSLLPTNVSSYGTFSMTKVSDL